MAKEKFCTKGEAFMIKGCSKRMIVLKDTGSDIFEEAYFVLKSRTGIEGCRINTEKEFVAEANRIIAEAADGAEKYGSRCEKKSSKKMFWYGVLFGTVICCCAAAVLKISGIT